MCSMPMGPDQRATEPKYSTPEVGGTHLMPARNAATPLTLQPCDILHRSVHKACPTSAMGAGTTPLLCTCM